MSEYPKVVPYEQALASPEVTEAVGVHFGEEHADEEEFRFLCLVMLCCAVWPGDTLPHGSASSGVAVFYECEAEDSPVTATCVPWVCELDTGASAVYRFEKVGDATVGFNESDNEPFQHRTQQMLAGTQWVMVRGALKYTEPGTG